MRRMLRHGGLLALGLVGACDANRVAGTIGQSAVPIESAFTTTVADAFGDDDLVVITASSIPSACRAFQFFEETAAQSADPDVLAEAWAASFPADFWQVDIVLRMGPSAVPARGDVWPGLPHDAFPEQAGQAFASFTHHSQHRDANYFAQTTDEAYGEAWLSHGGAVRFDRVDVTLLDGRFNTTVLDDEGGFAGQVEVFFRATPCPIVATFDATTTQQGRRSGVAPAATGTTSR
jgi:hypothetical protein